MLMGSPASGKSYFTLNYLLKKDQELVRLNLDTMKNKQSILKQFEQRLKEGKNVILDNTNRLKDQRKEYLDIALD